MTVRYVRIVDSGNSATFHLCPKCGGSVTYRIDNIPDVIAVLVGAFADTTFPAPKFTVRETHKQAWTGIPAGVEHFD